MVPSRLALLPTLAILFLTATSSNARADVLIIGSESSGGTLLSDSQAGLAGTGAINGSVDTFNGNTGTPTLATLQQYDAVVVWCESNFQNPDALGDVLADYLAGGGGVVVQQMCGYDGYGYRLGGQYDTQGYSPVIPTIAIQAINASLGTVHDPTHPIMQGVSDIGNQLSIYFEGSVSANTTVIAELSTGWPLVVEKTGLPVGRVVFINQWGYPTTGGILGYVANSDAALLIANAVNYVGRRDLDVVLNGPTTATLVDGNSTGPSGDGYVLLDFTLQAGGDDWTVTSVEFTASGSGDDAAAFAELALYEDTNGNDAFDGAGTDLLATATVGVAFATNNGTYTAALSDPDVPARTARRFFLVGKFNGSPSAGETFTAAVTAVTATSTGPGSVEGVPSSFSAGLEINPARLEVVTNGPASTVDDRFDAAGPTGDGVLLLDVTLAVFNADFSLDSLAFTAFGTGNDAEHYQEIALYQDSGSGTWDGASQDSWLAGAAAFPSDNGTWTASLAGHPLARGTSRRLYVVGILNGTAPNADLTFGVNLTGVNAASPAQFHTIGMPSTAPAAIRVYTPLQVTDLTPRFGPLSGNTPLVLRGYGFVAPVSLTVGDKEALGEGVVNDAGTEITGFFTPPGNGAGLRLILTNDGEEYELPQRFTYRDSSGVCAASRNVGTTLGWPAGLALLLLATLARRRAVGCV